MTNKEAIDRLNGMQSRCENGWDAEAIFLAIKALEDRPTGEHKCMTCKYCDGEIINKHCRECSCSWADLYEEAENDSDS